LKMWSLGLLKSTKNLNKCNIDHPDHV